MYESKLFNYYLLNTEKKLLCNRRIKYNSFLRIKDYKNYYAYYSVNLNLENLV